MNILIVARGYPTEKYKMNGIFEFDQAKALVNYGHKVVMACVDVRSIRRFRKWGFEHFEKDGVDVFCVNFPLGSMQNEFCYNIGYLCLEILYRKITKNWQPDIVHAHFINIAYITSKFIEKVKKPFLITEHSSLLNQKIINKKLLDVVKKTYVTADCVIAVSNALSMNIKNKIGIECEVVFNITEFKNDFEVSNHNKHTYDFVATGNLIKSKRIDLLIKTFHKFNQKYNNTTLTIFGDGELKKDLTNLIIKLKLQNKIKLMGMCSRDIISNKYKLCDCFVLPTANETFGVVFIEAMAMGLPVIATKCGGPEDFINETNGLLINVDDEVELFNAMEYMYQNSKNYDKDKITSYIANMFSPQVIAREISNIYSEVLSVKL